MLWGAEEFMIFFVWNDFFGIHRLRDNMQDINEIPKFMCKEPETDFMHWIPTASPILWSIGAL